jgi:heptosyltransferase-2
MTEPMTEPMTDQTHKNRKILIVGPSWVGDMVMAQSLFISLQRAQPTALIDVLAPGWSRPLLARMPQVRKAIELPIKHRELALRKRFNLGVALRHEHYDQVILLPNSFKSALIPLFARIPLRTGWRGEMRGALLNDCRLLDKASLPLMVQRFVALALPAGTLPQPDDCPRPELYIDQDAVQQTLQQMGIADSASTQGREPDRQPSREPARESTGVQRLVLCPGAEFGDSKQWPASHFADLANKALAADWQVVIVGSANDAGIATSIQQQAQPQWQHNCINLAGRTSLAQVIDVIASATAVVSNDSGLMHIAAALQRPLLALYGSTSADFTPPLADRVKLLASDIECRPCFQRTCPLGHKRCLTELSAEMAWSGVQEVLADNTKPGS